MCIDQNGFIKFVFLGFLKCFLIFFSGNILLIALKFNEPQNRDQSHTFTLSTIFSLRSSPGFAKKNIFRKF